MRNEKSNSAILVKAEISLEPRCSLLIETLSRLIHGDNSERQVLNSFPDSLRDFESSLSTRVKRIVKSEKMAFNSSRLVRLVLRVLLS